MKDAPKQETIGHVAGKRGVVVRQNHGRGKARQIVVKPIQTPCRVGSNVGKIELVIVPGADRRGYLELSQLRAAVPVEYEGIEALHHWRVENDKAVRAALQVIRADPQPREQKLFDLNVPVYAVRRKVA